MPPNAEDEKNGGMEVEVARASGHQNDGLFWSKQLVLGAHEGKHVFFWGDVYRNSLPTPSNYGNPDGLRVFLRGKSKRIFGN